MGTALTPDQREQIFQFWFNGDNYFIIAEKMGVSIGSVSNVITDRISKEPELPELRKLNVDLKMRGVKPLEILRTLNLDKKRDGLNVTLEQVTKCIGVLEKYGANAGDVLDSALGLRTLEEQYKKKYKDLVHDYEEKTRKLSEAKSSLEGVSRIEQSLRQSIADLQGLKALQDIFDSAKIPRSAIPQFISMHQDLATLGFSLAVARSLASELSHLRLTPAQALEFFVKHRDVQNEVSLLDEKKRGLVLDGSNLTGRISDLKAQIQTLQGRIQILQASVSDLESTRSQKEKAQRESLDAMQKQRMLELREQYDLTTARYQEEIRKLALEITRLDGILKDLKGREEFAKAIMTAIAAPSLFDNRQLDILQSNLRDAIKFRIEGLKTLSEGDLASVKNILIRGLNDIVRADIVSRRDYEELKRELQDLRTRNTALISDKSSNTTKNQNLENQIKERDEAFETIALWLFPLQGRSGVCYFTCKNPNCKTASIVNNDPSSTGSLLRKGYFPFKCVSGSKYNLTLQDLYLGLVGEKS